MVSQYKKQQVDSYSKIFREKPDFLLIKIGKTSHKTLESLRKELKKSKSVLRVVKNALIEKAFNKLSSNVPKFSDLQKRFLPLKESTALIVFGENWDQGLKCFYGFAKQETTLTFKLALLDNNLYDSAGVQNIAKLPSRNELMAKIIGSMKSPMSKFVYAMKYNTNKFVYILKERSNPPTS